MILIGFVLIPISLLFKCYTVRKSKFFDKDITAWTLPFMYPWGNEEDGILSGEEHKDKSEKFRIFYWTAIRNPVNNLRFLPIFSFKKDTSNLKFILKLKDTGTILTEKGSEGFQILSDAEEGKVSKSFSYLCYSGLYANYRAEFSFLGKQRRFWIGHKLYPSAKYRIPPYQKHGIGFGSQFKVVSK